MSALDIVEQLAFYGSYHSSFGNIVTHIVCVPAIEFASFGLGLIASDKLGASRSLTGVNLVSAYCAAIVPYYLLLEPVSGLIRGSIVLGQYVMARRLVNSGARNLARNLALVKALGWTLQILSHKLLEGRAPALLDNLFQAVVLAPYFVLLEVLFFLGFKPDLRKKARDLTTKKILLWKQQQQQAKQSK